MSRPLARIYLRESKDELLRGYSPDEMVRQCRVKAEQLGADVERVIVEAGKRDEFDCPGLLETIADAATGAFDYLIAYDMYRLSGELGKHLWVKESLAKTAVEIHYVTMEFAAGPEGELMETVQAAVGRYERMKTRARTQNGIAGKLAKKQPICNGVAPYGLEKVRDDRQKAIGYRPSDELAILERIVRELRTDTTVQIARRLNDEGVPTPSGQGRWRSGTISTLMANPIYGGEYRWGRVKRTAGRHADGRRKYLTSRRPENEHQTFAVPAVIDVGALAAAHAAMTARRHVRRSRLGETADAYALRGRLFCSACGGLLSTGMNNGYRRYFCQRSYPLMGKERTCTMPQVHAEAIEAHVWDRVRAAFERRELIEAALRQASDPGEAGARHASQVATLRSDIAQLSRRIANAGAIMEDVGPGTQTYDDTLVRLRENEATRAAHLELLASLERQAPVVLSSDEVSGMLRLWDELDEGLGEAGDDVVKQRALYRALGLRIEARLDERGVLLGRKHRYAVRVIWCGQLLDSAVYPSGSCALWDSHPTDGGPVLRVVSSSAAESAVLRARAARPHSSSKRTASTNPASGSAAAGAGTVRRRAG
jgi:DNA invertase Pin-like site-specific DNA recombinase